MLEEQITHFDMFHKEECRQVFKPPYERLVKILLVGNSGVGKSCLLVRFCDDSYESNSMSTIGVDFKTKLLSIDNKNICLQVWDTAGQERYHSITSSYYKGAQGVLVVYDITNRDSFDSVDEWVNEITLTNKNIAIILVGSKCDQESDRKVSREQGEIKSKEIGCLFYEASSKVGLGVGEIFEELVKIISKKPSMNLSIYEKEIDIRSKPIPYQQTESSNCCS